MRIQDLKIDPCSLGNKHWLVSVSPVHEYKENQRTNNVIGHRYTIALPEKNLEKIGVKIDGKQLMESPENGFVEVKFENLELYFYWQGGQPQIGARATGISLANQKS